MHSGQVTGLGGSNPVRSSSQSSIFEGLRDPSEITTFTRLFCSNSPRRLLHHSSTINIKGESFRLKEKRRAGLTQQAPENTAAPARDSAKSSGGGTA